MRYYISDVHSAIMQIHYEIEIKDAQSTPKVEEKIIDETESYENTGHLVTDLFQLIIRR